MRKSYFYMTIFFAVIISVLFLSFGLFPFGEKSFLTSDMRSQYVDFLSFFKNSLPATYSFELGMGGDIITFFAYYLCSPVNLLVFLFENMAHAAMLIFAVKLYLCALFCAFYFNHSKICPLSGKNILIALLSVAYAFCGFNMVYSMNIIWLDSVYLFPLLILSVEKSIFDGKRYLIYVTAAAVIFNFYTGIMSVYFSLLYIVALYTAYRENVKERFLFTA